MREYVRKRIRDIPTARVGILEKIEGDTARCIVNEQVYPVRFVAGLGLTERVGEEVVITFIDKDLSDGIVTGLVADEDTSDVDSGEFDSLADRVSANEISLTATQTALDAKQDKLTFDDAPVEGSDNPVKSGGIYDALTDLQVEGLILDDAPIADSDNPVKSGGIYDALTSKADVDDVDNRLSDKADKSHVDTGLSQKADKTYVDTELGKKVDIVAGKDLSTNDFTDAYKDEVDKVVDKIDKNDEITAGTATKITYDSKGLVTGGGTLIENDIPSLSINKTIGLQDALDKKADDSDFETHVNDKTNPHKVTKSQVGLGNVDNTSDTDKPISTATQTALNAKADTSSLTGHTGNKSNPHSVTKAQVGLGSVDNTSDTDKPISTATQTALDGTVKKTGDERIEGLKKFTRVIIVEEGRVTLNSGRNLHHVDLKASSDSDGHCKLQVVLVHGLLQFKTPMMFITDGDEAWSTVAMRDSPGSSDVVNTKYVLDQVAGMVNYVDGEVSAHEERKDNPHAVTKAQVGLGSYPASPADIGISTATQTALDAKQDTLTFDDIPVSESANPVKSGGIWQALDDNFVDVINFMYPYVEDFTNDINVLSTGKQDKLTFDDEPVEGSDNPVTSKGIRQELDELARFPHLIYPYIERFTNDINVLSTGKQDKLTFDDAPVEGSDNPVKSGGIYDALTDHTGNKSNPHSVTKAQVGLGNVDNTSDANKPISTATQTALDAKASTSALNTHTSNKSNPHSVTKAQVGLGSVDNTSDADKPISTATQRALNSKASTSALNTHVNTKNNPHKVNKAQVGLGNVDNTSDANKPISTATQTALDAKADTSALNTHTSNKSNPHSVTKAQVGLGSVDNTSDANKPVSTATNTELAKKVAIAQGSGNVSKFALTDASGNLNTFRTLTATDIPNLNASKITAGTLAVARIPTTIARSAEVTSHTGRTDNPHGVTKAQVGLSNVNNTSDASKPISTATQTALNAKASTSALNTHTSNKTNPHSVTKAQVGLGAYPSSPADIGISTATQTALDGKVNNTGDEEIAGYKTFSGGVYQKSLHQDIGVPGYNSKTISRLTDVNNKILFDDRITKEGNGGTGRKVTLSSTDANGDVLTFSRIEFVNESSYKEFVMSPNGTWRLYRVLNADGTGYTNTTMRASPSALDAVNTKYVLDRVSEMVDYVDDGKALLENRITELENRIALLEK